MFQTRVTQNRAEIQQGHILYEKSRPTKSLPQH